MADTRVEAVAADHGLGAAQAGVEVVDATAAVEIVVAVLAVHITPLPSSARMMSRSSPP